MASDVSNIFVCHPVRRAAMELRDGATKPSFPPSIGPAGMVVGEDSRPSTVANPQVFVVFTSEESTVAALDEAGEFAAEQGAHITLLVPHVVPYPLSLEQSPVSVDWSEMRFKAIADRSTAEASIRLVLCRDRLELLKTVLSSGSTVILGVKKRWWPTAEARLARRLVDWLMQ